MTKPTVTLQQEVVRKALSRAYLLGQTYWQQADSESYKQNAKAGITDATFRQLIVDTCAALDVPDKPVTQQEDGQPFSVRFVKTTEPYVPVSAKPVGCRGCQWLSVRQDRCMSDTSGFEACTDFDRYTALQPVVFTNITKVTK